MAVQRARTSRRQPKFRRRGITVAGPAYCRTFQNKVQLTRKLNQRGLQRNYPIKGYTHLRKKRAGKGKKSLVRQRQEEGQLRGRRVKAAMPRPCQGVPRGLGSEVAKKFVECLPSKARYEINAFRTYTHSPARKVTSAGLGP